MIKNIPHIKPFLKWAGGKRQLIPEIKKQLPENINNYTYYEPFVGAGAVFFELQNKKAVINDSNTQLILTYNVIRDNVEGLIELLKTHKELNSKEYYYKIRNLDRNLTEFNLLSDIEKAGRLIFLNKTCFNGLYRVNSGGAFNVPYGKNKNPAIFEETVMRQISGYFNSNKIEILNVDFEQAVSSTDKNSFVYFDPPYHLTDKTSFTAYQADGFDEHDQERLRNVMIEMTTRGVKCLLSNSNTWFIRELYKDRFEIIPVQAKRAINSEASGRGAVDEVLIRNY